MALNIDYFDILPTDRWLGGAGVYWLAFNSSALMIEVFFVLSSVDRKTFLVAFAWWL